MKETKCLKHGVVHRNGGYTSCVYYEAPQEKKCDGCQGELPEGKLTFLDGDKVFCANCGSSPSWQTKLDNMKFPTYTDYGCDGASEECCGNCGGENILEEQTKEEIKKFISAILEEKAVAIEAKEGEVHTKQIGTGEYQAGKINAFKAAAFVIRGE